MAPDAPLSPGSVIGILGGGQLGRMLAMAAAELGFAAHIYAPPGDNPASDVARASTIADWSNEEALVAFADSVDVITFEFENVPEWTARFLDGRRRVLPGPDALSVAQDRLAEKTVATGLGLAVPRYTPVGSPGDLEAAISRIGESGLLKTRRLGYDGKGQTRISGRGDARAAWQAIGGAPAILEEMIPFNREVSALVARGRDGSIQAFDVPENRHRSGILDTSTVPANVAPAVARRAVGIAEQIAVALNYVGVLAVELFVVGEGETANLLFNEMAPRVHNSGHWTTDACLVSQFEQHIRAIAGWPLVAPHRHSDVTMTNLIGADVEGWETLSAESGACVHIYGKAEVRPGRKMGHVNRIRPRTDRPQET